MNWGRATGSSLLAFSLIFGPVLPGIAEAKGTPRLSTESATSKRDLVRQSAGGDADSLETGGAQLGDPVLFLDAADKRLENAARDRSIEEAEAAKVPTMIGLDILHFLQESYASGKHATRWKVVASGDIGDLIDRANAQLRGADDLVAEIEDEQAQAGVTPSDGGGGKKKKDKRRREPARPGTAMIGTGSFFVVLAAGGVGMVGAGLAIGANAQSDAEALDPSQQAEYDDLEKKGENANLMTYIGAGLAGVGLAVGIPLLIIGVKKRKAAGPGASASLRVSPTGNGLLVSGKF